MVERRFYCRKCGNEDQFDVDETTETIECKFCLNGIMDKIRN